MTAILVVGKTGSGKTTLVKSLLKKANKKSLFLYDVNNEYKEFVTEAVELDFDIFAERAKNLTNAVILFEEATIFLSNKGSNFNLKNILVRKRHTKNTVILVFHSFRTIPRYVFDLCNFIAVKKTSDNIDFIDSRFEHDKLSVTCREIFSSKDKFAQKIITINS